MSITFSYLDGAKSLDEFVARRGHMPYAWLLYSRLGDLYVDKQRYQDAATTYRAFVSRDPVDEHAPTLSMSAIEAYRKGGFADLMLQGKLEYVQRYGFDARRSGRGASTRDYPQVVEQLKTNLKDVAQYYHATAQKTKKAEDYAAAAHWYRGYLSFFPDDPDSAATNYLLADALFESHQYAGCGQRVRAHRLRLSRAMRGRPRPATRRWWPIRRTRSACAAEARSRQCTARHRFGPEIRADLSGASGKRRGADARRAGPVRRRRSGARGAEPRRRCWRARRRSTPPSSASPGPSSARSASIRPTTHRPRIAFTHALACRGAERSRARRPHRAARRGGVQTGRGQAQGRRPGRRGARTSCASRSVAPGSKIVATAQYDAAASLINAQAVGPARSRCWRPIAAIIRRASTRRTSTRKLAVAYVAGRPCRRRPPREFERIAANPHEDPRGGARGASRAPPICTQKSGRQRAQHARCSSGWCASIPTPVPDAIEVRQRLLDAPPSPAISSARRYWQREIVKADASAGAGAHRSHQIPGGAARSWRWPSRRAMPSAHQAGGAAEAEPGGQEARPWKPRSRPTRRWLQYQVAETTTAATYETAELYRTLAHDLLHSERPKKLSSDELEQYDSLLEEQAYPFEEQAISIHEINAKRTVDGVYDDSVRKSFAGAGRAQAGALW